MTLMQQLAKKTRERRPDPRPYTGPDKSSANGNRPLTFPTPYHGGKRRWADEILQAFGPERECVYVEPFSGSAAVLLANPRPYAREILCDTNPHISNVFRCLAWAPETTAFWADWPTTHQDLTARHTWLLRWAVDHVADIEADPDFHDPKAAGWWLWGKSNWIGTEFAVVRGLQVGGEPDAPTDRQGAPMQMPCGQADMRPLIPGHGGASGISAQRTALPTTPDKRLTSTGDIPQVSPGGGRGVSPQAKRLASTGDIPQVSHAGRGIAVQRTDISAAPPDKIPAVLDCKGRGVAAQRKTLPAAPDKRPLIGKGDSGGTGVQAQRTDMTTAPPDKIPHIAQNGGGIGVTAQREGIADDGPPDATHGARGAIGRARQARQAAPEKIPHVKQITAGRGVSAQRHGDILYGGGKGYQQPAPSDVPYMPEHGGGRGVNAQRKQSRPDSGGRDAGQPEKRPFADPRGGGNGVQAQRMTLPAAPDQIPGVSSTSGQGGVNAQSAAPDVRPYIDCSGLAYGRGVQSARHDDTLPAAPQVPRPTGPVPLTGDRLLPWFQALAERLYRVIILNRGWQSGLTPTVLQQTRSARKPPVRVLIDPPYKGVGKLYGMSEDEAGALAVASWRWAAENGSREGWRIAYACREGDFDDEALALGWTCSKTGIAANHSDSTQEVIWFSPHCLRPGQPRRQAPGEQGRMFETGE